MSDSQEMLYKEQPQQQQPQVQEERKFNGGGGGEGKAYVAFGGSAKSSQTICRSDPENPGQQICKKVEKYSYIDPRTGKQTTRTSESEEYRPDSGFLGFFNRGGNQPSEYQGNFENKRPSLLNRIKTYFNMGDNDFDQYYQQQQQHQQQRMSPPPPSGGAYYNQPGPPPTGGSYYNQPPPPQYGGYPGPQDDFDRLFSGGIFMDPFRMMEEAEKRLGMGRLFHDDEFTQRGDGGGHRNYPTIDPMQDLFSQMEREFFSGGMMGGPGFISGGPIASNYQTSYGFNSFNRPEFQQRQEEDEDDYRSQHPFARQFRQPQPQPQQPQQQFQVNQSVNPVQGIKFKGKIYDV